MAFTHREVLVNGDRLPDGWTIEWSRDLQPPSFVGGLSPIAYIPEPMVVLYDDLRNARVLDPAKDWVSIDGEVRFGHEAAARWAAKRTHATDPPLPPSPEPDRLTGKIIGYRGWTLDGYRLRSANHRQHGGHWNIGPNKAECRIDARRAYLAPTGEAPMDRAPAGHDAPHPDCECGLYAYFDVRRENNPHHFRPEDLIWGAVAAWGRVEVHASGFRAEYAEPVVLAYSLRDAYEDVVKTQTIAGELGLPFVPFGELPAEAAKHGQEVPESMRPARTALGAIDELMSSWHRGGIPPLYPKFERSLSNATQEAAEKFKAQQKELFEQLATSKPLFTYEEMLKLWRAPSAPPAISKPEKRRKLRGIKATLKTSGPPFTGKWREGDLVRDRKGETWACTASGTPGAWEHA